MPRTPPSDAPASDTPSSDKGQKLAQRAIAAGLKHHYDAVAQQPPPEELTRLLEKVDRRTRLTPKR